MTGGAEVERLREAIRAHRDDPLAWEEQGNVDAAAHRDLANEKLWVHIETERSERD